MNFELHKLSSGYIITSDEKIKVGDLVINHLDFIMGNCIREISKGELKDREYSKVIAQKDQIDLSFLSSEDKTEIGCVDDVDIYKLFQEDTTTISWGATNQYDAYQKYAMGFRKAQELMSDKIFTVEDMAKELATIALEIITENGVLSSGKPSLIHSWIENKTKLLTRPKSWKIELEMEITGQCDCPCHEPGNIIMHFMTCCNPSYVPKLTDGKLRVLKIISTIQQN